MVLAPMPFTSVNESIVVKAPWASRYATIALAVFVPTPLEHRRNFLCRSLVDIHLCSTRSTATGLALLEGAASALIEPPRAMREALTNRIFLLAFNMV
jgi:hypothetical protein